MTNNQTDLLPCAHCGGKASYEERAQGWIVRCDRRFLPNDANELCPVNARTRDGLTKNEATTAWNTRANAEREWVPTSERLPENPNSWPVEVWTAIRLRTAAADHWFYESSKFYKGEWTNSGGKLITDGVEVVAWMPIPPYQPTKESNE